jgi:hypothetical protein
MELIHEQTLLISFVQAALIWPFTFAITRAHSLFGRLSTGNPE